MALLGFVDVIGRIRTIPASPVRAVIESVNRISGYEKALLEEGRTEATIRLENILELVSAADEYDRDHAEGDVDGFLETVALVSDVDRWDGSGGAVNLMTVHSAKGLEFPIVFIVAAEERIFPHDRSMDDLDEIEEERRLFFVGITRAKEELVITCAGRRSLWGSIVPTLPSRFLHEMAEGGAEEASPPHPVVSEPDPAPEESYEETFQVGEWIHHDAFGRGRILELSGEGARQRASIRFETVGTKLLVLHYGKIRKERG
jgi:DNA helicase-2/ATP-dependent DNA helicase PcrA